MLPTKSPIHILDGITNRVEILQVVSFARQHITQLCRTHAGKWVNIDDFDPFSCSNGNDDSFIIQSRRMIFNPRSKIEKNRNKDSAGKGAKQKILIVDGGFLYTERDPNARKVILWAATDTNAPTTSHLDRKRVTVGRRLRRSIDKHRLQLLKLRQTTTSTMFCPQWWPMEAASPTRQATTTTTTTTTPTSSSSSSSTTPPPTEYKGKYSKERDALCALAVAVDKKPNSLLNKATTNFRGDFTSAKHDRKRHLTQVTADSIDHVLSLIQNPPDPNAKMDLLNSAHNE
jgi:hypothetical protein